MHTATMLQSLFTSWPGFTAPLLLLAIIKILTSGFFRDRFGEMRVLSALRGLDPATYRHFHDLDLPHPTERGTVRVEHVVVSPYGIFVIGTSNRRGSITGSEHQPDWVQRGRWHRARFQNPLLRNRVTVDALMKFLNLPDPPFRPVVVFTRDCEFKTPLPGNVLNDGLVHWIRRHNVTMLDPSVVSRAASRLTELQESLLHKATEKPQLHALHVRPAA